MTLTGKKVKKREIIVHLTNQSINQPTNQPTNQPASQPANQSINQLDHFLTWYISFLILTSLSLSFSRDHVQLICNFWFSTLILQSLEVGSFLVNT